MLLGQRAPHGRTLRDAFGKHKRFLMNTMLDVAHRCQIPSEHVMKGQAAENDCPAFPVQCGCRPWRFGRWLANLELPCVSEIQLQEFT